MDSDFWIRYCRVQPGTRLRNSYYLFRHGESTANIANLICCIPESGIREFPLTPSGERQVVKSARRLLVEMGDNHQTHIISSDYLRAHQSAILLQEILDSPAVHVDKRLRERTISQFHNRPSKEYRRIVWNSDRCGLDLPLAGGERVVDVLYRMTDLLRECESLYVDSNVIFVTHCDPARILLTLSAGICPAIHYQQCELVCGAYQKLDSNFGIKFHVEDSHGT